MLQKIIERRGTPDPKLEVLFDGLGLEHAAREAEAFGRSLEGCSSAWSSGASAHEIRR